MPELPEVETIRRGLEPVLVGARITRVLLARKDLRFAFPARFRSRLTGARFTGLARRAKFLLAEIDRGETLIMHLGMSGRFIVENGETRQAPGAFHLEQPRHVAHDHVRFELAAAEGPPVALIYNDVRRFGFMDLCQTGALARHPHLKELGLEPLGNGFHAPALAAALADRRTSIKAALLDQRWVAGLGNIYVCEALHRAGIAPMRAAGSLVPGEIDRLAGEIRAVLGEALAAGGSSLRDYVHADGSLGYFQHAFRVYGREGEPCTAPGCGGTIARLVQSGRSTFHCAACQR